MSEGNILERLRKYGASLDREIDECAEYVSENRDLSNALKARRQSLVEARNNLYKEFPELREGK